MNEGRETTRSILPAMLTSVILFLSVSEQLRSGLECFSLVLHASIALKPISHYAPEYTSTPGRPHNLQARTKFSAMAHELFAAENATDGASSPTT